MLLSNEIIINNKNLKKIVIAIEIIKKNVYSLIPFSIKAECKAISPGYKKNGVTKINIQISTITQSVDAKLVQTEHSETQSEHNCFYCAHCTQNFATCIDPINTT